MNQAERVQYHKETETFFEKNQIRDMFAQMTNQILLDLPEDPLTYLIDHIKKRQHKKIICIVGQDPRLNSQIANMLCESFDYCEISAREDRMNLAMGCQDNNYEDILEKMRANSDATGFIFNNFPSNVHQALWFTKNRIVPEKIFQLSHLNRNFLSESILGYEDMQKQCDLRDLTQINLKVVKEFFKDIVYPIELNDDFDGMKVLKLIRNITAIRHRQITPKRPPRILFLGYPSNNFFL